MQTVHVGLVDDVDSSQFVLMRVIEYLILHFVYIIQNIQSINQSIRKGLK